ncbi:hypothetical protein B0T14DRAFT_93052 [Immersiella caudata]|uniref:Uncharacterized protein n=1 Tax=Immersiella caudata TaxID=314043 RepID=A0AA40C5T7_9PEZI|nr:hypothetical protein B0T14DRAFT_93052 [Immersiella caudata]
MTLFLISIADARTPYETPHPAVRSMHSAKGSRHSISRQSIDLQRQISSNIETMERMPRDGVRKERAAFSEVALEVARGRGDSDQHRTAWSGRVVSQPISGRRRAMMDFQPCAGQPAGGTLSLVGSTPPSDMHTGEGWTANPGPAGHVLSSGRPAPHAPPQQRPGRAKRAQLRVPGPFSCRCGSKSRPSRAVASTGRLGTPPLDLGALGVLCCHPQQQ